MRVKVGSPRSLAAGVAFATIGAASLLVSADYRMGSALHMGPGYYPVVIGLLLLLVGGGAVLQGLVVDAPPGGHVPVRRSLRPAAMVTAAVALFGAMVDRVGLVPAVFSAVVVAALAMRPVRPIETLVVAAALSALCALVFVYGLQLPFRLFL